MEKIDYIEIYVSDLKRSVDFYKTIFQLHPIAYLDQETHSSILVQQGAIRLILTAAKQASGQVAQFVDIHGEGVKEIAFSTPQVEKYYQQALQNGRQSILAPTSYRVGSDIILKATVSSFGSITHSFISRTSKHSVALPFFKGNSFSSEQAGLLNSIDHVAVCVHAGDVSAYVDDYIGAYGFTQAHEEQVLTHHSGMKSKAVQSENGQIKIVFVEPVNGQKISQVAEFLQQFGGPGVQHIAFSTTDIVSAVKQLRESGLETLTIPDGYYHQLRLNEHDCQILREHAILFDKNEQGSLYQIFSKPVAGSSLFFEIIQRIGCSGFGSNNIKALFQAIEQEQWKRAITLL